MAVSPSEIINLYSILLKDLSSLEIVNSKSFSPNLIADPETSLLDSKVIGTKAKSIIGAINELLSEIQSVESSIKKVQDKRFTFFGDYLETPLIKEEILTLGTSLSDAFLNLAKEIYGNDLSNPKSFSESVRDAIGLPEPVVDDFGKFLKVSSTGTIEYTTEGGGGVSFVGDPDTFVVSNSTGDGLVSSTLGLNDILSQNDIIDNFDSNSTVDAASARTVNVLMDLLGKLIPQPPDGISHLIKPTVSGGKSGTHVNGDPVTYITLDKTPTFYINSVYKADQGLLSVNLKLNSEEYLQRGSIDLGLIPDTTGQDGDLSVAIPYDPYAGEYGKENFYLVRNSTVTPETDLVFTPGVRNTYTYKLSHIDPQEELVFNPFELDELPGSPEIDTVNSSVLSVEGTLRRVSGVESYGPGSYFLVDVYTKNCVSNFFPSTIVKVSGAYVAYTSLYTSSADGGVPTSHGANVNFLGATVNVSNGVFVVGPSLSVRSYNLYGNYSALETLTADPTIRIDTKSDETIRVTSGQGDFPVIGVGSCGETFDSNEILSTAGNEELFMEGGVIKYPSGDFTSYGASNYSSITGRRWFTKKISNFSGAGANITFNGALNFGGSTDAICPGDVKIYVKVDGSSSTPWIDAQSPYGGGDITSEGQAGLLMGESTGSYKEVTFGIGFKQGDLYVRIGLVDGDNKIFTNISVTPRS